MATGLNNYPGVSTPNSDYPDGNIVDGATPINALVYSDMHQTLAKILRNTGLNGYTGTPPNGLPENEYSGFQYIKQALEYFHNRKLKINYYGTPNPQNMDDLVYNSGQRRVLLIAESFGSARSLYLNEISGCEDLISHTFINNASGNLVLRPFGTDKINHSTLTTITLTPNTMVELVCIKSLQTWLKL